VILGLGLWWKSLPLGILALLGAYLNPIFLHNEHGHPLVLPVYLVALLAMALTLSAWRPDPFRPLTKTTNGDRPGGHLPQNFSCPDALRRHFPTKYGGSDAETGGGGRVSAR
jgi:hypothetical protein